MKIYHGTKCTSIQNFEFGHSRVNLDFGEGIYFTTNLAQAMEFSCKNKNHCGAVYESEIDVSKLKILRLKGQENEDLAYTLYLCRICLEDVAKETIDDFEESDIIWGELLDGKIKQFKKISELFNCGDVSFDVYAPEVKLYDSSNDQICVKSLEALAMVNEGLTCKYYTRKKGKRVIVTRQEELKAR